MKKLSVFFICIILFTNSCEKEDTKIENLKVSEFDLKVNELGIGESYNLPTIKKNPNNPFESIGILHNYSCDLLTEKSMKSNIEKGFDKEAYCKDIYNLFHSMNMEVPNGLLENIPLENIPGKSSFTDDATLNQCIDKELINENLKNSFVKIREMAMSCSNLKEFQSKLVFLEDEILKSTLLSNSEKENVLGACAIARYSSAYWADKGVYGDSKSWWMVFLCDAAGGFIGGGTTLGVGTIAGATAASALAGYVLYEQ